MEGAPSGGEPADLSSASQANCSATSGKVSSPQSEDEGKNAGGQDSPAPEGLLKPQQTEAGGLPEPKVSLQRAETPELLFVPPPAPQAPFPQRPRGGPGAGGRIGPSTPASAVFSGVPIWVWISLACVLSGFLGALGVLVGLRLLGPERAKSQLVRPLTTSEATSVHRSLAKSSVENHAESAESRSERQGRKTSGKSVREILEAVVKLEMPISEGKMNIGAGFFIDPRGWIATNYHVIRDANSAMRVRLFDGTVCKVAGILAQEPSMDLAILKVADPPPRLEVLDINFPGEPELGEEIQVCGHPHNLSFTFVKGTVGRLVTTLEMLKERGNPLLQQMHAPLDMIWIQHSARIAPGNSGGPVVNQQGQVVGVNSFVNELSFGYAVPVRYLRALVALCDEDKVIPFPDRPVSLAPAGKVPSTPPSEPNEPDSSPPTPPPPKMKPTPPLPKAEGFTLSPEELQKFYDACSQFYWKPTTPEQYSDLEVFARAMSRIKYFQTHPELAPQISKEQLAACAEKAEELMRRLQESPWTKEHWQKIHALAAQQLQPGRGILLHGTVLMNAQQIHGPRPTLLFAPEGMEQKLLLIVSSEQANLPVSTKLWLIGEIKGIATLSGNQKSPETYPLAEVAYLVKEE